MMESIVRTDQMRRPKSLSEETDPMEKHGESKTGVTNWKRGRCGRMCRAPVH